MFSWVAVGAISAFVFSRNHWSNYLPLNIGIWQFACKAHIDEKRIFSRFGFMVHDTTVRECLNDLSKSSLESLQTSIADGLKTEGIVTWKYVLDNVQRYDVQRKHRIGRQLTMKVGTTATAIKLDDYAPNAFDLEDHLQCVMKMERQEVTTATLYESIDWAHLTEIQALHCVRILAGYIEELAGLQKDILDLFRGDGIAKHRMREGQKMVVQPLGTNTEKEVETQGMLHAMLDFEKQMGLDERNLEGKMIMPSGDGASFAAILWLKKYLAQHPDDYKSCRNWVSLPELWHTKATNLNSIVENHYGPIASPDPSSLSKSATTANTKRPTNLKKCDFYPTARSVVLFFEAWVLDCWRIYYGIDDLTSHFKKLKAEDKLPTLEELHQVGRILVKRYAMQEAYEQALSLKESETATSTMKVPQGTPRTKSKTQLDTKEAQASKGKKSAQSKKADNAQGERGKENEEGKQKAHIEKKGFDGDHVLANAILFQQDAGWWVSKLAKAHAHKNHTYHAKIWMFSFTGTNNHNYSNWLLELFCLFKYEALKDMENGLLNNWLVNITGELGKWMEADLMQEHYNGWLEEMAEMMVGDFDDKFYQQMLSPNVQHFLRIKEELESAFGLEARSKAHGSAHLCDEFQSLLRMHKEDQLHLFPAGCSIRHAAVNTFGQGYARLEEGWLDSFLKQSLVFPQIMKNVKSRIEAWTDNDEGGVSQVQGEEVEGDGINESDDESNEDEDNSFTWPPRPCSGESMFVEVGSGELIMGMGDQSGSESSSEEGDGEQDKESDNGSIGSQ
ncbi:hypothetical protein DXG01_013606 [Tephrocybe rancida]|nr:hypothetical protein DXG01_013606 [Tephrocybe rancida]